MADQVDWLPVLQKVFKDYGTQLRRSKVKKFAAKVARQQGRTEDKKELQSQFKAFLKSDMGRSSVVEKDDVLSLGLSEAAGPSQPRLSLFDLAEAAASLSKKQPTRTQPTRPSAKPKSQDNPLTVTKGPRSIRKRKTSTSPDEAASMSPASTAGMQTRGRTKRHSPDPPPDGPVSSPVLPGSAALNSKTRAAKQQLAADAGLADIPVQGGSDALPHDDMLVEAGKAALSRRAGTDRDQLDKAPDQQPAASHDISHASPATTSDSPAQTPSSQAAPVAMLTDTDQEPGPSRHEQTAPDSHAILSKQESNHGDQTGAARGSLQDSVAGLHDQAEVERSDGGPIKSAVKAKKRKHKTEAENRQLPSSATQVPEPDAALPEAAALVPAGEPAVKPKKRKRKLNADDSSQPAPAAKLPEQDPSEPEASHIQQESDKPAAQLPAAKAKKQKHRYSKQLPSDANMQAVESPAGTVVAADGPAAEAAVAIQRVQEPIEAVAEEATTEPKQMKDKKKKKKRRRIEDVATGSQPDLAENPAVPAAAVIQDQPELVVTEEPSVQPDREELANKLKKKKKKKKKKQHSDAGVDAQQTAAVSAAGVEPETYPAPAEPVQEPAVKPRKKKKHKQDASVEPRPAGTTAVDTIAAAAEIESVPGSELQQADIAASAAAEVKPKKRRHKDSASRSKPPSAADGSQLAAVKAGAPRAEAQEPEQPAVKPKRKRKSKGDTTAAAEAATDAPSGVPAAAAATAQTPKAKKAKKVTAATAKESSCTALPGMNSWRANQARTDVKKGKFTKQEKDTLKQAAHKYAQDNGLPSDDFAWLLNKPRTSGNRKDVAGAWQTIAQSLPHRTYKSVYACGSRMLSELNYQGKWSKEEDERLRQLVGEKGSKWKEISTSLGRFPEGCRDRWRELKLGGSRQSGRWSEEETTKLRSLVNEYLARKQEIEEKTRAGDALTLTLDDLESSPADTDSKPTDGRIILDDIDWDVISAQHGTRAAPQCLTKWYTQLAPSMVSKGEWGSGDDRRLLRALAKTGVTHDFQVNWGQLVASRSAMQARRRWRLMLKCVKDATDREFHENLHTLLETFTPDLLVTAAGSAAAHDPEAVDDLS